MIDADTGRSWLGATQPTSTTYDDWITYVEWGPDVDHAIDTLRAADPKINAVFQVAEQDGLGITPAWPDETTTNPLAHLPPFIHDTDWIVVTANVWRATFTADMIIHPLAPSSYARHHTPTWTIFVTAH